MIGKFLVLARALRKKKRQRKPKPNLGKTNTDSDQQPTNKPKPQPKKTKPYYNKKGNKSKTLEQGKSQRETEEITSEEDKPKS